MNTYYAKKHHMSQAWDKTGKRYSVTVLKTMPLTVTQVKTDDKDGYSAIQVGFGEQLEHRLTKPVKNHLKKTSKAKKYPRHIKEIKISQDEQYKIGDVLQASSVLKAGDLVTVTGQSKGRGFSGVMKRWGFSGGPRTHGQSDRMRAPGSIGQGTDPGRVHKGKKMAGRYGNQQFSIRNLLILEVDQDSQQITLSGPVPGSKNSIITITKIKSTTTPQLISAKPELVDSNTQVDEEKATKPTPEETKDNKEDQEPKTTTKKTNTKEDK